MRIIGVSGIPGTGKTTFSDMLCESLPNAAVIHVDDFLREYKEKLKPVLVEKFGAGVLKPDGSLWLPEVHKDSEKHEFLNEYLKKPLMDFINSKLKEFKDKNYVVIDYASLQTLPIWRKCFKKIRMTSGRFRRFVLKRMRNKKIYGMEFVKTSFRFEMRVEKTRKRTFEPFDYDVRVRNGYNKKMGKKVRKIADEISGGFPNPLITLQGVR